MSHATLPHIMTEANIDPALAQITADALKAVMPYADSFHRALDKAVAQFALGRAMTLRDNVLTVQSSRHAWVEYEATVDACGCDCRKGVCWHRGACALLISAQTIRAAAFVASTPLDTDDHPAPIISRARRQPGCVARARVETLPRRGPMTDAEYQRACALANECC